MSQQLGLFDGQRNADASKRPADAAPPTFAVRPTPQRERPPLRVRESGRARRLTLRMLPPDTLELVVPRGTRPREVAEFVRKHTRWIERARTEIAEHYPEGPALPDVMDLTAVSQHWPVRYVHEPAARPICRVADAVLLVRTRDSDRRDAPDLLRRWLIEQARFHLRPWLLREAAVVGVAPTSVRVRLQRTRWGSCSSAGGISLNAGLLFLAPELVRYLLIHELSHMLVLNHSRRFWRAVERHEPDWRELDRRLGEAWGAVPIWAHERAASAENAFDLE
jgi:predicted metal-dependent hydrolase